MRALYRNIGLGILATLALPAISLAHVPVNVSSKQHTIAPMLKQVMPAVVNIAVEKKIPLALIPYLKQRKQLMKRPFIGGVGSGVIFNAKKGYIITNAHVVSDSRMIVVTLKDGRRFRAKVIGNDSGFDIAIIQIPASHLQAIPFGDSDTLKVGDFVAAIGSPFGLDQSVTSGVISALNRTHPKIEGFQSFIQTDASINPGNSGGALVNMKGQLIGINTAILGPDANIGIGFAIPSNMVKSIVHQLIKYGKVKRGMLGVVAENITNSLASAFKIKQDKGTIVTQVLPGSAAAVAGLKSEDVIETLDGKAINSAVQLRNTLGLMRPGTEIQLSVMRDHKLLHLKAKVGDPKAAVKQRIIPFVSGMRLRDFAELQGNGDMRKGVLITRVSEMSDGALAGLYPGDVIVGANQQPVRDIQDLIDVIAKKPKQLLLKVSRNNKNLFLVIQR